MGNADAQLHLFAGYRYSATIVFRSHANFLFPGLSMLVLTTDINTIVLYMREGQVGTTRSLLAMISACLLLQLMVVYLQTSGGSRCFMVKESLIVLSGTKPGVDGMRVASGADIYNPNK